MDYPNVYLHYDFYNPEIACTAFATSGDASMIASVCGKKGIFVSIDSGSSYSVTSAPTGTQWTSIASSYDGAKLVAVINPGGIYTSADKGGTWTPATDIQFY